MDQQIDTIKIADEDAISDSGVEIGNLFAQRGIENVMLVGVHENMCVIGRPFGLRNMVRLGKNVVLVRDMTDALYNPRMSPQVSHLRGTELVAEHIEKYVCPTVTSSDLLGGPAFRFKEDKRPHVTLIASDDEYFSEKTLPAFADLLREQYGCYCTVSVSEKEDEATLKALAKEKEVKATDIPGLDELKTTDVLLLFARRRALPKEQLDKIRAYLDAGKPLVALRTCSHAFTVEGGKKAAPGSDEWKEFDHDVLGGNYHSYEKKIRHADIEVVPEAAGHPILAGVAPSPWKCTVPAVFRDAVGHRREGARERQRDGRRQVSGRAGGLDPYVQELPACSIRRWARRTILPTSPSSARCWSMRFSGRWIGLCRRPTVESPSAFEVRRLIAALSVATTLGFTLPQEAAINRRTPESDYDETHAVGFGIVDCRTDGGANRGGG